jgi:predicted transcriptional regulator
VQEIMTREVVTVPANISLEQLVHQYFLHYPYRGFPVKDNGNIMGLITLEKIKDVPPGEHPVLMVKDFIIPRSAQMMITPGITLEEALKKMTVENLDRLLVMQQEEMVGVITRSTLMRFVEMKQILEPH